MIERTTTAAPPREAKGPLLVREIECKSILTKSGIEGVDYALNPYVGCEHGCEYCYATFMKRFTGHQEEWGTFVDVRVNAAQVLARQLKRAKPGNITFGTVTDAYQPLEERYCITRACLEVLLDYDFPVTVLTKSALVLRDLDLIKRLKEPVAAFTITTLDDEIRQRFEPHSSPIPERLEGLRVLADAGIPTWAFCGPLLPFLSDTEEEVNALFRELKGVNVGYVLVDSLNLRGAAWGRMRKSLQTHHPDLVPAYSALRANRNLYHAALMERTRRIAERHGLDWRGVDLGC
ncbi:MAG: radical SAM protein [Anaerolineae bacterium]|nr:radical SAM protein [Anaerolineae bacterium]NIN94162.1 radical SAM protein [Anaerolineae bacterium]NIQ77204.1 radical SAM protein [Anaerolineae bacterium]